MYILLLDSEPMGFIVTYVNCKYPICYKNVTFYTKMYASVRHIVHELQCHYDLYFKFGSHMFFPVYLNRNYIMHHRNFTFYTKVHLNALYMCVGIVTVIYCVLIC